MMNEWKNNLLSLPDPIFFDIMRNYLGELKTPFNKHDLIRSLTTFIMKKEVRQRILDMIDEDDSMLLTAIALMKSSGIDELYEFLKYHFSFLELHNRIANLQERLLIRVEYPSETDDNEKRLIMLNPFFEDELRSGYLDTSALFKSAEVAETQHKPWLNEQLLAAFISFAANNRGIFQSSGTSRKRAESRFDSIFRGLPEDGGSGIITFIAGVCVSLGFIIGTDDNFKINAGRISEFGKLPASDRRILIAAAAVVAYPSADSGNLERCTEIISGLFKGLKNGTRLHRRDLKSLFYLIRRQTDTAASDTADFSDKRLTEVLYYAGFLVRDGDFRILSLEKDTGPYEKLRIQSNFEISAPAGLPVSEEISAAVCCEIKSCDITRTYELTKQAFTFALDSGLSATHIIKALGEASEVPLPQNIDFSMQAWEKEYRSISLNYGIVMTVSRERLPFIEHSPGLKDFFTAEPAPGVFILDPARESEWRKAFADAGFDMLPRTSAVSGRSSLPKPSRELRVFPGEIGTFKRTAPCSSGEHIDELVGKIKKLSMSQEDRQQLEARAGKKLILSDSQLKSSGRPAEKGEAGGLDHRAKIRLAERTLEMDNLLEITTSREFELEKRLVKPLRIEKIDSGNPDKPPLFKIIGIELPDENEVQIPITRISHLKMLKSSLFTP